MNRQFSSKTAVRILCALFVLISAAAAVAGPVDSVQAQAPAQQAAGGVTDTWAVQISSGADPDQLALQMGAQNLGQIGSLTDYYLFRIPGTDSELTAMADVFAANSQVVWFEQQVARQQTKRAIEDPVYLDQWHLVNANVEPAWNAGFTGTGVTIAIVDDGLQYTHADLGGQYNSAASYDFKDGDSDPMADPFNSYINPDPPFNVILAPDEHGTSVAGMAAADYNGNTIPESCGVGVAYDANLAGLRLVAGDGFTTDFQQASALSYAPNINSIYNNSWGPFDDAQRLEGPGTLALSALQQGVTTGRNGKGSIYVWAAGNGRSASDNVNYDGYANSRYTIAVGAVDDLGKQASYSEPGAAMLVTAPSASDFRLGVSSIVSTDLKGYHGYNFFGDCTDGGRFTGTSVSAPIVSGVVALMLDANPNLGWRDVQNILARTAVKNDPTDADWVDNRADLNGGISFHVNHKYGFGLVNAAAAVAMANPATYVNLPGAASVSSGVVVPDIDNQNIPDSVFVDGAYEGVFSTYNVPYEMTVEHVEVVFKSSENLNQDPPGTGGYRGDLRIVLTSPSGTVSVLSEPHADSAPDYDNWKFMTVRNWGESSLGEWTLRVTDEKGAGVSVFDSWQLNLYGTSGASGDIPVPGDYNGDNITDIGVFRPSNGTWYVRNQFNVAYGTSGDIPVPGDYNGDNTIDIAVFRPSNGTWYVRNQFNVAYGTRGDIPVPGDYNGDNITDIAVFRPSNGIWYVKNQFNILYGTSGDIPVPGDYDGGGVTDIAVFRPSNGIWYVRNQFNILYGTSGDIPVPRDYNGGGVTDIAVFRPSNGIWYVKNQFNILYGTRGDIPVPGDYNGGGVTDIAVFRPSNGIWYAKNQFNIHYGQ